jgi:hypothetical protein
LQQIKIASLPANDPEIMDLKEKLYKEYVKNKDNGLYSTPKPPVPVEDPPNGTKPKVKGGE